MGKVFLGSIKEPKATLANKVQQASMRSIWAVSIHRLTAQSITSAIQIPALFLTVQCGSTPRFHTLVQ